MAGSRRLSRDDRIFLVRLYFRYRGNIGEIREVWSRERKDSRFPTVRAIRALATKFTETGRVDDRTRSGKPANVVTLTNVNVVRDNVREYPMLSTRKRALALNMSRSSLCRILRDRLKLRAYKMQTVHWLKRIDRADRLLYATTVVRINDATVGGLWRRLIMSDEAHFEASGHVYNRQNVRFWGSENPRIVRPKSHHPERLTVWCGISSNGVIGPYFFEDERRKSISVTGERYRNLLNNYVFPILENDSRFNDTVWWWQQDGATAHTARETMRLLYERFGREKVISSRSRPGRPPSVPRPRVDDDGTANTIWWPSRSPDLSALDFFLWGYLKDRVYDVAAISARAHPNESLLDLLTLRANIVREVDNLNRNNNDMLARVMAHVVERAGMCVTANGDYMTDVVFKK